ncbi:hypothetical protein D6833_02145 [Candidatus Parcubacteria bacterium]|nr:MAG: hypothetical protein D6833_02145 [Candidatus Parcubacteria bacterium]
MKSFKHIATLFLSLFVLISCASISHAQKLGLMGIGGRLSLVKAEDSKTSIGFGAHADLGEIVNRLHLYPSVEYFQNKAEVPGFFGTAEAEASVFSVNADVRYYFPTPGTAGFFAGGGIALHSTGSAKVQGQKVGDSQTDFGVNLLGGVEFPLSGNLVLTGLAKFVLSDNNGFKVTGGLTYLLGK